MPDSPILSVRDLSASFRTGGTWTNAVDALNFDMAKGELLAIVGESGSGKSVTALSILRLLPAANSRVSGAIEFDGVDLLGLSEEAMCTVRGDRISMIFQEPMTSLNPVLTIGAQIGESLACHRGMTGAAADAEVLRLLDRVRIPAARARMRDYPHRLSGGMRQRAMIAMALACDPALLIADEPTTALDVTVQAQILDLLRSIQADTGMSILFITHDMGVVAEVADRVLVMLKGKKVEEGTATGIFAAPSHAYTKRLLAAAPRLGAMSGAVGPRKIQLDGEAPDLGDDRAAGAASAPLLTVENLTTRFDIRDGVLRGISGRVHAVENVSFSVGVGETLSLVGESGCGKSTLGRSVLRLIEPRGGSVRFGGADLLKLDARGMRAVRRDMQMIFQDPFASLNPRVPVGRAIAEPIVVHGLARRREADERAARLLAKVGLSPDMAARLPHEFSGGQRQRICIARALALSPKLIVADEAVSALDVSVKAQVLNLLLDLQRELGLSYIFISHDMATVERVSHRVAVMYLGEIVEIGPRSAIIGDPRHPYTRKLLGAVPVPDPARRRARRLPATDELPSPVRPPDFRPPVRNWRDLGGGHLVMEGAFDA